MISKVVSKNLLLVLAHRPAIKDETTRRTAKSLQSMEHSLHIVLGNLSAKDSKSLVAAAFQVGVVPGALASAIFDKTKGHPRFILEICDLLQAEQKVLVEKGVCKVVNGSIENLALPNSIRSVFVARIDQLSSSEQITLKVASVIGPMFSLTLICDVYPSGASKLQIAEDMASLLRERLVEAVDPDSGAEQIRRTHSTRYAKRESLEETRKSVDALLNMNFMFASELVVYTQALSSAFTVVWRAS